MAPGKRKSPFIGAVDTATDPILYKRYTKSADILLEPAKRIKKTKLADEQSTDSKRNPEDKKSLEDMTKEELLQLIQAQRNTSEPPGVKSGLSDRVAGSRQGKQPPVGAEEASEEMVNISERIPGSEARPSLAEDEKTDVDPKKKAKKKKQKNQPPAKAPSGPSNADEAEKIRNIMGIRKDKEEIAKPATGFSFGFQGQLGDAENEEAAESGDEEAAGGEDSEETDVADKSDRENGALPRDGAQNGKADTVQASETDSNSHLDAKLRKVLGQKADYVARRVFVGGMPFSYDEEEVRDYWSYCGEIEDLDLMRFPDTGRFKGIAFVTFAEEAGYKQALKCNGEYIEEQRIKVEPCISAGPKANSKSKRADRGSQKSHFSSPAPKTPGYHVAYVGNLAFEANQKQLKDIFEGCNVTVIRLHTDKETGKSKGYAHVHFADEASLDRAVEANGKKLLGRPIRVGYAQPKKE